MGFPIKTIQVDNGPEFVNDDDKTGKDSALEKAAKQLEMELRRIRPYSPWQNGKVERSHHEDGKTLYKQKVFTSEEELLVQVAKGERRYNKTAKDCLGFKLGNASADSKTTLTTASNGKGWDNPLATFWMQRSQAATLTVGGLNDKIISGLPVYAMALPVGEDGNPVTDANIKAYASQITDEGIKLTIPEGNTNGYAVALVQPTVDFGNVVITTDKSKIDKNNDKTTDGNYEIPYTATYNMSENLKSIIVRSKDFINDENCKFTFTVELDKRLTAKSGAGDYKFTSPIFDLDKVTVAEDGSTVIAECKLKKDWTDHISELLDTPMVLTGTGVLEEKDFNVGDIINTTGHIEVTISDGNLNSIYIPANVCQTLMEEEIIPGPGDSQEPGNTDEGAPKTGDATSMELLICLLMLTVTALTGSIFWKKSLAKK